MLDQQLKYGYLNRRNNSGLAGLDLSNHRNRKLTNYERVNYTLDAKLMDKNNSLSLVAPFKFGTELKDGTPGKKSPGYGKRNASMGNHRTYDDRKSRLSSINPLDLDARLSLLNNSNMSKYKKLRNHRYKLHTLIEQKRKSASNRKKSSNSKRVQKIDAYYKNKFVVDKNFKSKFKEQKKQFGAKSKGARKLLGVSSAQDYSVRNGQFLIQNGLKVDKTYDSRLQNNGQLDHVGENDADKSSSFANKKPNFDWTGGANQPCYSYATAPKHEVHQDSEDNLKADQTHQLAYEELLSNNPEDCKDTIFSGEGEILGSVGETIQPKNLSNEEMISLLQKENNSLKSQMKKIVNMFLKFKHNSSISVKKENIKLPNGPIKEKASAKS